MTPASIARTLLLSLSLIAASMPAGAASYSFTLTLAEPGIDPSNCLGPHLFGCKWLAGDQVVGRFSLHDDTSALPDGIYSFIPLDSWRLKIGEVVWDMNLPFPASDFVGFLDGQACGAPGVGFPGMNPGLRVTGGVVTGFCGGVNGSADRLVIDFEYSSGPGRFIAYDEALNGLRGAYRIDKVPEPGSLAMLGLGVAGMALSRRRRRN